MSAFAQWIVGIVSQLAALIGLSLTKKATYVAAAIATSISLTLALGVFIASLMTTIGYGLPSWAQAGAIILPANLPYCISAVIAAKVARFVYEWNMENLRLAAYIT